MEVPFVHFSMQRVVFCALAVLLAAAHDARAQRLLPRGNSRTRTEILTWRVVGPVTPHFHRTVHSAVRSVPPVVWSQLRREGWSVQLAEYVTDAVPALRGRQPRGWPLGTTWDNTEAVHLPQQRLLVLAEKRRDASGQSVISGRHAGVFRHEVGHAYDAAAGQGRAISSSPDFLDAYIADCDALADEDATELSYYMQGADAGRQEAFAEAFAILLGGGSDKKNARRFQQCFPNVVRYVESHLHASDSIRLASQPTSP
jgi:hypothetical protein